MKNIACLLLLATVVYGHDVYRSLIPNGFSVPSPCGGTWSAVGHYNPDHHTHDKNPFGLAFKNAGHTWTTALCQTDSDGDGISNGYELGDPTCSWSVGQTASGKATGHPGICEPVGSTQCASQSYSCGCHGHNCVGK